MTLVVAEWSNRSISTKMVAEIEKQGGFKCGITVPGRRGNMRPIGKMHGLNALKAAVPGFVRRKGRSGGRISALEAAYEEYRIRQLDRINSHHFRGKNGGSH